MCNLITVHVIGPFETTPYELENTLYNEKYCYNAKYKYNFSALASAHHHYAIVDNLAFFIVVTITDDNDGLDKYRRLHSHMRYRFPFTATARQVCETALEKADHLHMRFQSGSSYNKKGRIRMPVYIK